MSASPASAAGPRADFNGDGRADVVVAAPEEGAGAVFVKYGGGAWVRMSASGLVGAEGFGAPLATCDLNGDGFTDLIGGAPESSSATSGAAGGAVVVLYGSGGGLGRPVLVTQDSPGVSGTSEIGDRMGAAVSCGYVTGDSYADIVVGVPGEGLSALADAGIVMVIPGSSGGLNLASSQSISQDTVGVPGTAEAGDRFGAAVAVGDITSDNRPEIVAGAPGENSGIGLVTSLRGSSRGWTGTGSVLAYDSARRHYGQSLAIGQFALGGSQEVAVGSSDAGGTISMLRGGSTNLTRTNAVVLTQDSSGVPGVAEPEDTFGSALAAGDITGDGADDLLVGNAGEAVGTITRAGSVLVLKGSSSGLTGTGSQVFTEESENIPGAAAKDNAFGASVALADRTGDGLDDAIIGTPRDDVGSITDAGSITRLRGTSKGLTANGAFSHDASTMGGTAVSGMSLGAALVG